MPYVTLRDVTDPDVEIFFDQQTDAIASAMAAFPIRDHASHISHWNTWRAEPSAVQRTILSDDAVAGNIVCWVQDGHHEVGYWIGRPHWGRGIATAALALFLDEVRRRPLFAHVAPDNVGSRRVLEKCGFAETGNIIEDDGIRLVGFVLEGNGGVA